MKYVMIFLLLLIISASAQTISPNSSDTFKKYEIDNLSSRLNCDIYAVKMLQAAAISNDTIQQELYLNSANAYQQLSNLGTEC